MLAARLTAQGGVVHCPGGGTHHGRPDRASGFCYLNDPVLALLTWLDLGLDNLSISISTRITATACRTRSPATRAC